MDLSHLKLSAWPYTTRDKWEDEAFWNLAELNLEGVAGVNTKQEKEQASDSTTEIKK